jgi:hypothetical protein
VNLINWMQRALRGEFANLSELTHQEPSNSEPDIETVIRAHNRWKHRLSQYINGDHSEALSLSTVLKEDQCALGKWILGTGEQLFSNHPAFTTLKQTHAEFHFFAGRILAAYQGGEEITAQRMLDHEFQTHSKQIQMALAQLRVHFN